EVGLKGGVQNRAGDRAWVNERTGGLGGAKGKTIGPAVGGGYATRGRDQSRGRGPVRPEVHQGGSHACGKAPEAPASSKRKRGTSNGEGEDAVTTNPGGIDHDVGAGVCDGPLGAGGGTPGAVDGVRKAADPTKRERRAVRQGMDVQETPSSELKAPSNTRKRPRAPTRQRGARDERPGSGGAHSGKQGREENGGSGSGGSDAAERAVASERDDGTVGEVSSAEDPLHPPMLSRDQEPPSTAAAWGRVEGTPPNLSTPSRRGRGSPRLDGRGPGQDRGPAGQGQGQDQGLGSGALKIHAPVAIHAGDAGLGEVSSRGGWLTNIKPHNLTATACLEGGPREKKRGLSGEGSEERERRAGGAAFPSHESSLSPAAAPSWQGSRLGLDLG
ncbi:unnamed protein product, partial [Discosporangium mesarthrocarpum]